MMKTEDIQDTNEYVAEVMRRHRVGLKKQQVNRGHSHVGKASTSRPVAYLRWAGNVLLTPLQRRRDPCFCGSGKPLKNCCE